MAGFLVPRRSMIVRRCGTLDSLVPEGHLARFVWWVLCSVDFGPLEVKYRAASGGPGRPPYHPRVLAALWSYGMTQGLETAAAISAACDVRDDFRWLAGGWRPSDQTLLNFLAHHDELGSIWVEIVMAMHRAGHVDLSAIAEDGTKLRANASSRSFRTADDLAVLIDEIKAHLGDKVKQLASADTEANCRTNRDIRALQDRLERAERASLELGERAARQHGRREPEAQEATSEQPPAISPAGTAMPPRQFTSAEFRHDADRDVMVCPGGAELHFIGTYGTERGGAGYRLYSRHGCDGCSLKPQCTNAKGRRLKISLRSRERAPAVPKQANPGAPSTIDSPRVKETQVAAKTAGPRASLTDPDAVMMLATSEKRWAPSYNADLAVTRHGVIVSQFLTKHPGDYHAFGPALAAVVETVGRPDSWVGDGHYGTQANLLLAHRAGVTLYAPPAGQAEDAEDRSQVEREDESSTPDSTNQAGARFGLGDFRHNIERDVMMCPADQELRVIGTYPTENGLNSYKLYGRTGCGGCPEKSRCTTSHGRRLKVVVEREPSSPDAPASVVALARDLRSRMETLGERVLAFRRQTVEPVNAQLKQHGIARFHVRGLARCSAVLTIACIAHNLMKWRAREVAHVLKLAA